MEEVNKEIDSEESVKDGKETDVSAGEDSSSKRSGSRSKKAKPSKIGLLQQKVAELEAERDEVKDLLLRKAAEFDNYKRRTENEYVSRSLGAKAELIKSLLPVLDDFSRSLSSDDEKQDYDVLRSGVELIYKNFSKVIEDGGAEVIPAKGEEFNPEVHEALMQVESDEYESGIVIEEHVRGYKIGDRVIRHSQVLVSK